MPTPFFNPDCITWLRFGEVEPPIHYRILHIDEAQRIADVIFKFPARDSIILHRHKAPNHTFVVQGEHHLYAPDGSLREVRPTGSYTVSPASEAPHREGGGAEDAIVLFSMRPLPGEILYEILDDAGQTIAELTLDTLQALFEAQQAEAAAA